MCADAKPEPRWRRQAEPTFSRPRPRGLDLDELATTETSSRQPSAVHVMVSKHLYELEGVELILDFDLKVRLTLGAMHRGDPTRPES